MTPLSDLRTEYFNADFQNGDILPELGNGVYNKM